MAIRIITGPDQGDAQAVIAAAELHPDKVVLDCLSVVDSEPTRGIVDSQPARLELLDDLGTEYTPAGGGGSGDGCVSEACLDVSARGTEGRDLPSGRHADRHCGLDALRAHRGRGGSWPDAFGSLRLIADLALGGEI